MPQGKELSMGMYTMCKNLTRHFVIDVGRLPSIETVPGPGKLKKHSLVPRILQFYKRFILMVVLKDGDTHKSQGAGKDTSRTIHLQHRSWRLSFHCSLSPKTQGFGISGTGKGSLPVSQMNFLLELQEASDTIKLGKL